MTDDKRYRALCVARAMLVTAALSAIDLSTVISSGSRGTRSLVVEAELTMAAPTAMRHCF